MFNEDFFPTPTEVIDQLIEGLQIAGKICYDPEAGNGNIVERLHLEGASQVLATEIHADLRKILQTKCTVIGDDFLKVESHQISHVDCIIMNPPFSNAVAHILHAYAIAPAGCKIRALSNIETVKNTYSKSREELKTIIDTYGDFQDIGDCFSKAERKTGVNVALIRIDKPGANYSQEFEGFFMDDEPEENTGNGLIPYNVIRDLVNRYVEAVKIFDQQLDTAVKLNEMVGGFFSSELGMQVTKGGQPIQRNDFKKRMQKSGWSFIFSKLNMAKYATKGLKEDINKFVETQENIPFTMRNIYKMLEIVIGTQGQRMDKAILEVFDKVTSHHADNRFNIEGWKTNSHYLLTRRFIMPTLTQIGYSGEVACNYSSNFEMVEDLIKALCYITGDNYDKRISLRDFIDYPYLLIKSGEYIQDKSVDWNYFIKSRSHGELCNRQKHHPGSEILHNDIQWGKWFTWGFFKCRAYKKGTMHFEFLDEKVWGAFNQRVAKLKGYPLAEKRPQTKYQEKQNGHKSQPKKPVIISTIRI
jgi:hypothetical protein